MVTKGVNWKKVFYDELLSGLHQFSIRLSKLTTLLSENVVSQSEVTLALGYLMGDTCLYRAACEEPHVAKEYLRAAEIIIETMKLLPQYVVWSNIVSLN